VKGKRIKVKGERIKAQGSKYEVEGVRSNAPNCGYKIEFESYALGLKIYYQPLTFIL